MPSGDEIYLQKGKKGSMHITRLPTLLWSPLLLSVNCFILSGSSLQHQELWQGMVQGALPRHSENSWYWQRGEQVEEGLENGGRAMEVSLYKIKNLTLFQTHQICALKPQRCRHIPDQSESRWTTPLQAVTKTFLTSGENSACFYGLFLCAEEGKRVQLIKGWFLCPNSCVLLIFPWCNAQASLQMVVHTIAYLWHFFSHLWR